MASRRTTRFATRWHCSCTRASHEHRSRIAALRQLDRIRAGALGFRVGLALHAWGTTDEDRRSLARSALVQVGKHHVPVSRQRVHVTPRRLLDVPLSVALGLVPVAVVEGWNLVRRAGRSA